MPTTLSELNPEGLQAIIRRFGFNRPAIYNGFAKTSYTDGKRDAMEYFINQGLITKIAGSISQWHLTPKGERWLLACRLAHTP